MVAFTKRGRDEWRRTSEIGCEHGQLLQLNALIAAWHDGSAAGGEELYYQFRPVVNATVENRLNRALRIRVPVEDMTQSIFLDMLTQLRKERKQFESCAGLHVWVMRLARNRVIKQAKYELAQKRSVRREQRAGHETALEEIIHNTRATQKYGSTGCDQSDELRSSMTQLDARCRQIVSLLRDGMSQTEIAGRLGVTTRTIRRKMLVIREVWKKPQEAA